MKVVIKVEVNGVTYSTTHVFSETYVKEAKKTDKALAAEAINVFRRILLKEAVQDLEKELRGG